MIKFTKEEISLCKQVAEKYRKEIKKGDWLYSEGRTYLVVRKTSKGVDLYVTDTDQVIASDYDFIPLWTISDCLEFLREKGWTLERHYDRTSTIYIVFTRPRGFPAGISGEGKTDREACLKAVLAVLKEKKRTS